MGEDIDWRHRGDYIAKHGLTPDIADQAFNDPNRLMIDPDPASVSGRTVRIIGWATSAQTLVTVIVLPDGDQMTVPVQPGMRAFAAARTPGERIEVMISDTVAMFVKAPAT